MDKEKLDHAHILISTKSLEVINLVENVMVDGKVFNLNFVEYWGLGLGDDACLLDENLNSNSVSSKPTYANDVFNEQRLNDVFDG